MALAIVLALSATAVTRFVAAMRQQSSIEARLARLATRDHLTGLPNRLAVHEHSDDLMRRVGASARSMAVLFLDIDQFKLVNDTLRSRHRGPAAGGRRRPGGGAVRADDLVGRISGDEFIVVAPDLDRDQARSLGERIRVAFLQPLQIGIDYFVTVSIGVAVADQSRWDVDAQSLIRDADTAMYRSKAAGRNAVTVFDTTMREQLTRRVTLEADLRRALAAERAGGLLPARHRAAHRPHRRLRGAVSLAAGRRHHRPGGVHLDRRGLRA